MRQLSNLMDKKGKTLDGEKRYQVIESDERYFIIDEGTVGMEKKVTPNLIEGEVKIVRLNVKDCPLKVNCVELEGQPGEEVTSICKYLGTYHYIRPTVPCLFGGYLERDVLKLLPDPITAKAKYARTHFLPAVHPVKKSHAHFVCRK